MKISLKITKKKVTAKTKSDLFNKINPFDVRDVTHSFSTCYDSSFLNVLQNKENGMIRLYSIQKFNPKTKETVKTITRGKNKGEVIKTREQIVEGHWEAYILDIPKAILKSAKQNDKNYIFEIKESITF